MITSVQSPIEYISGGAILQESKIENNGGRKYGDFDEGIDRAER